MNTIVDPRLPRQITYPQLIRTLVEEKQDLSREQARAVINAILEQRFNALETATTLVALGQKGETAEEIMGAVEAIRMRHPPISLGELPVLNLGGTGGDRAGTFNISTTAAFVVAAAGIPVVKHGNKGSTSGSGSSDVMTALGVDITRSSTAEQIRADLHACNFAFVATSEYYRFPAGLTNVRRSIGVPTLFNLAGPLVHPTRAQRQIIGVARPTQLAPIAEVLCRLGGVDAFVVHGVDGLDEVSCVGETLISEVRQGQVRTFSLMPQDFDVQPCHLSELQGGTPQRNAEICTHVLRGLPGPHREATVVTASVALVLAGRAPSFKEAARITRHMLDSGQAQKILKIMKEHHHENTCEGLWDNQP
ncbi:anthranilate phosphoribosyltransferase [Serratia sp. DD3]|uniref:anthranilate phosphoribosyltransferase n=1 Tax=Serratia sp. DD3 TaxID=1410619 RepID=UPI0003C51A7A|nr:anthranilate phosphoribosyltransferase [Serratia sp. DD3]KEY57325.1 anthranilate phosphoribosyltransferase 2 [Serratia sp. DD3]